MRLLMVLFTGIMLSFSIYAQQNQKKNAEIVEEDLIKKELLDSIERDDFNAIIRLIKKDQEVLKRYHADLYPVLKNETLYPVRYYLLEKFFNIFRKDNWEQENDKIKILEEYRANITGWTSTEMKAIVYLELDRIKNESSVSMENIRYISNILTLIRICKWDDSTYKILPFIAYPFSEVRKNTYRTFAVLKDDRIVSILLDMLQSKDPIERVYALDALYYIHDKRAVKILLSLLEDENKSVRYYAIRTLEKMKRTEAVHSFIRIMQHDKNTEVRIKALNVLKNFQAYSAFYPMKKLIYDKNPQIRRAAINGVLEYKNHNMANDFSRQLAKEKYKDIQLMLIHALIQKKSWGTGEGLKHVVQNESDEEILLWALYCIAETKYTGARAEVLKRFPKLNNTLKSEAILTLGEISDYHQIDFLIEILKNQSEDVRVRYSALWALKKINSRQSILELYNSIDEIENDLLKLNIKETVRELIEIHLD